MTLQTDLRAAAHRQEARAVADEAAAHAYGETLVGAWLRLGAAARQSLAALLHGLAGEADDPAIHVPEVVWSGADGWAWVCPCGDRHGGYLNADLARIGSTAHAEAFWGEQS